MNSKRDVVSFLTFLSTLIGTVTGFISLKENPSILNFLIFITSYIGAIEFGALSTYFIWGTIFNVWNDPGKVRVMAIVSLILGVFMAPRGIEDSITNSYFGILVFLGVITLLALLYFIYQFFSETSDKP